MSQQPAATLPAKTAGGFLWAAAALIAAGFWFLLIAQWSPLRDWFHRVNYHELHVPWASFVNALLVLLVALPLAVLAGASTAFYQSRQTHFKKMVRTIAAASVLLTLCAGLGCFLSQAMHGPHSGPIMERLNSLSSAREIHDLASASAENHQGRWPAHLAMLGLDMYLPRLTYRYSRTPKLRDTLLDIQPDEWRSIAPEIDAHSDFLYLAGDLVESTSLAAVASEVITVCGKKDLPEIPVVIYDSRHHVYEYPYAARPVVFADGHGAFVPLEELPALIANHNAARAKIGLPAQTFPQ